MRRHDLALTAICAPKIDEMIVRVNGNKELNYYTHIHRPFLSCHNITGCPALVMPMGLAQDGLPMSVQISAARWREADVLRVARAYEAATPDLRVLPKV